MVKKSIKIYVSGLVLKNQSKNQSDPTQKDIKMNQIIFGFMSLFIF